MELIKTHKINLLRVVPGDTIKLHYAYEDETGLHGKTLTVDRFDEEMLIDTVLVYRTEEGEYGLKGGRALIMGESV